MINWKLRLKNKTTLVSLGTTVVAFAYQMLGFFNVVPPISQDVVVQIIGVAANVLLMFGVVVDPTTAGIGDSQNAMGYIEPRKDEAKDVE